MSCLTIFNILIKSIKVLIDSENFLMFFLIMIENLLKFKAKYKEKN